MIYLDETLVEGGRTPLFDACRALLATQFDQALPVPIRAARQVGRVLRHVSISQTEQSDYRYYS